MTLKPRVLVVDDYEDMRFLFESTLDFCAVTALPHGAEALAAYRTGNFDLLVIDIPLRGDAGFEMIRHIRNRCDRVPIVAVSVKMEQCHRTLDALNIPRSSQFVKPFSPAAIRQHIGILLANRPAPAIS